MALNKKNLNLITISLNLILIIGTIMLLIGFGPIIYDNLIYYYRATFNKNYTLNTNNIEPESSFSSLVGNFNKLSLEPVNYSFSLVIQKLGVSVPIVANVSVTNNDSYMRALRDGVAHAITSDFPSSLPGNTYIFAHSGFDLRYLSRYSRSFNLLDKLKIGDTINVIYDGSNYEYKVTETKILPGFDTTPLMQKVDGPILTLQSCYPPGTTLNRIIVTSELKDIKDLDRP